MTRSRATIAFAVGPLVLLGACDRQADAPKAAPTSATPAVNNVEAIRQLPEGQRTAVFLRAIRDAGRACQAVTALTEVTAQGGPATWQATCDNGDHWIVAISPEGTATVTDRAELRGAAGKGA